MEYEKIKQLMDDMGNSKLTEINVDFPDGTKISMKKEIKQEAVLVSQTETKLINDGSNKIENIKEIVSNSEDKKDDGNIVKSPMVGTFYIKPSPTSEPYVEIGKDVKQGDTLCIIEAMKLMNEIESEFSGKIMEIFVKDGDAVEYGTDLFKIK
ncbi:MAG: acetyl-CoA carboxylase biotin carboxyl carrier protein [Clostridia bacterium]|jgi:acetyl-CoA carboxylase biotin carboxyl carrier protein|nr:acetyl-CoA carboxylase biotin carboxyl carrier protein [Clostridia bacterium]